MKACHLVEFTTPRKFLLRGLWFGPKKPRRVIVFVHGLGGSVFSMRSTVDALVAKDTAVFAFNNRGHDWMSGLSRTGTHNSKPAGRAHEVFTDCVDDIEGALNFVRKHKVRSVYLAGHSTGCQKSAYWAFKKKSRGVQGIILLAPVSDWAAEVKRNGIKKIARAVRIARELVRRGKKHSLLPEGTWPQPLDAQRFLSLCTPESVEEIFSYALPYKLPRVLRSITKPLLILWAEKDEFGDRPVGAVQQWFEQHAAHGRFVVVPRVGHGFRGGEQAVAQEVRAFIT